MPTLRLLCVSGFMLFVLAPAASAENTPLSTPRSRTSPGSAPAVDFSQVLYKGVVGNMLETLPMDPAQRVSLQRGNAVISNTLSGRSLSVLAKLANPAVMIAAVAWGLWAASNIDPAKTAAESAQAEPASGTDGAPDTHVAEHTSLTLNARITPLDLESGSMPVQAPAVSVVRSAPQPKVIKVWVSQPSY